MALTLHTISYAPGSQKKKKRVGRGNSSGHGTYATRGLKGQSSRSGASGLTLVGMKHIFRATPKLRGFKSDKPKNQVININDLNSNFKDGDKINPKILAKNGLIDTISLPIKLLGKGELKIKNLEISGIKLSNTVVAQLEKNGCKVVESTK